MPSPSRPLRGMLLAVTLAMAVHAHIGPQDNLPRMIQRKDEQPAEPMQPVPPGIARAAVKSAEAGAEQFAKDYKPSIWVKLGLMPDHQMRAYRDQARQIHLRNIREEKLRFARDPYSFMGTEQDWVDSDDNNPIRFINSPHENRLKAFEAYAADSHWEFEKDDEDLDFEAAAEAAAAEAAGRRGGAPAKELIATLAPLLKKTGLGVGVLGGIVGAGWVVKRSVKMVKPKVAAMFSRKKKTPARRKSTRQTAAAAAAIAAPATDEGGLEEELPSVKEVTETPTVEAEAEPETTEAAQAAPVDAAEDEGSDGDGGEPDEDGGDAGVAAPAPAPVKEPAEAEVDASVDEPEVPEAALEEPVAETPVQAAEEAAEETEETAETEAVEDERTPSAALSPIEDLVGPMLLRATANGTRLEQVPTASVLKDKVVALYVSSREIEGELRRRQITQGMLSSHLAVVRARAIEKAKDFEVVYVPLDADARDYRDAVRQTPWPAMSLVEEERRQRIVERFEAAEVPCAVLLHAGNMTVINKGGLGSMLSDPDNFPWPALTTKQLLSDPKLQLLRSDGSTVAATDALQGKHVALYFSAHWCKPCREFTPQLAESYSELNQAGKDLEVVFVSHDKNAEQFEEYRQEMPWLSLPFTARQRAELQSALGVKQLPTLIILDENLQVVTKDGRSAVQADPLGRDFPWHPKLVNNLATSTEHLLDGPAVVLLAEDGTLAPATKARLEAGLTAAAAAFKDAAADDEHADAVRFFVAKSPSDAATAVRHLTGMTAEADLGNSVLGEDAEEPAVVVLDLPHQRFFVMSGAIEPARIEAFVHDVLQGRATPQDLDLALGEAAS